MNDPHEIDDNANDDGDVLELEADAQLENVEAVVGETDESDESDEQPDNAAIREMRAELRRAKLENRKLRAKVPDEPATVPVDIGPRPTEEEHGWDVDAYNTAVDAWNERRIEQKLQAEKHEQSRRAPIEQGWQQDVERFQSATGNVTDESAKEAIQTAQEFLTPAQQMCLVKSAKDPASLLQIIGNNPELLDRLDIADPIKFTAEMIRIEMENKFMAREKPAIDTPIRGAAAKTTNHKKQETKMLEAARESGDYSAYYEFKRKNK